MQRGPNHEQKVCESVPLSNVTKRKKVLPRFSYRMKERLSYFRNEARLVGGRPLVPGIVGKTNAVRAKKRRLSIDIRS